jgi:hypothetical protein
MLLVANPFYRLWVGPDVPVPFELSAALAVYTLVFTWNGLFGMFINGTGKVLLQTVAALVTSVLAIGLGVLFAGSLRLGSAGVVLATTLVLLPGTVIWPIQMRRLLNGTARGVWAR